MTLGTHAIVGASIASILPSHPVLGFALGFTSHYLLDAIPHWDYKLLSSKKDPNNPMNNDLLINIHFIIDLFKMGVDTIFGFIIVFLLFGISDSQLMWTSIWGAIGALTPDALQFVYFKWRHEPVKSLQKFHFWIHGSREKLGNRPILGIFLQIVLILFVVAAVKLL